ncbi:hypothetical protein B0H10DRAFT_1969841 [Mycena sp. CBHHK59/15]|nr:hypothetical protein B0H10DRAFT_1969841 [Mycena sp. CBHHK59/15]
MYRWLEAYERKHAELMRVDARFSRDNIVWTGLADREEADNGQNSAVSFARMHAAMYKRLAHNAKVIFKSADSGAHHDWATATTLDELVIKVDRWRDVVFKWMDDMTLNQYRGTLVVTGTEVHEGRRHGLAFAPAFQCTRWSGVINYSLAVRHGQFTGNAETKYVQASHQVGAPTQLLAGTKLQAGTWSSSSGMSLSRLPDFTVLMDQQAIYVTAAIHNAVAATLPRQDTVKSG